MTSDVCRMPCDDVSNTFYAKIFCERLTVNCLSFLSWSEDKVPVLTGASDDPVVVQPLSAISSFLLLPSIPTQETSYAQRLIVMNGRQDILEAKHPCSHRNEPKASNEKKSTKTLETWNAKCCTDN